MSEKKRRRVCAGDSLGVPGEEPIYGKNVDGEFEDLFAVRQQVIPAIPGPASQGITYIEIKVAVEFEPHGRASEMWEEYVSLRLPQQQAWTRYTKGWFPIKDGLTMGFSGRTLAQVLKKTRRWIDEMFLQGFGECIGCVNLEESRKQASLRRVKTDYPHWLKDVDPTWLLPEKLWL